MSYRSIQALEQKINYQSDNSWIKKGKWLTELFIPFTPFIYKPAVPFVLTGLSIANIYEGLKGLYDNKGERTQHALSLAKGVAGLSVVYFQNQRVLAASAALEIAQHIYDVQGSTPSKALELATKSASTLLFLWTTIQPGSIEARCSFLLGLGVSNLYQAYQISQDATPIYEKALTTVAKIGLGCIRFFQISNMSRYSPFHSTQRVYEHNLDRLENSIKTWEPKHQVR
jgi:hypothetical protein